MILTCKQQSRIQALGQLQPKPAVVCCGVLPVERVTSAERTTRAKITDDGNDNAILSRNKEWPD